MNLRYLILLERYAGPIRSLIDIKGEKASDGG